MHSYLFTLSHSSVACDCPPKPAPCKLPAALSFNSRLELTSVEAENKRAVESSEPAPSATESYHETMRRQQRRLHSWPSREVDDFEEDMNASAGAIPRMRALESTAALSLATFTSLLIEFVVRLDHLVEAVDELAKLAKFKQESAC